MLKRCIAVFLLILMVGGMMAACDSGEQKANITEDEAVKIAYEDMGVSHEDVASIHVHEGTYEGVACYNIYINARYAAKTYVISAVDGKILAIQDGISHSH